MTDARWEEARREGHCGRKEEEECGKVGSDGDSNGGIDETATTTPSRRRPAAASRGVIDSEAALEEDEDDSILALLHEKGAHLRERREGEKRKEKVRG